MNKRCHGAGVLADNDPTQGRITVTGDLESHLWENEAGGEEKKGRF